MNKKRAVRLARRFWNWARPILVVVLVCTSLRSAVADWNDVPSGSMRPTIIEGDRIFVNKLAYDLKVPYTTWRIARWGAPVRGEMVVCFSPADGKRLVKRVIGVEGDRLEMRDNRLFVNGEPLNYAALEPAEVDAPGQAHHPPGVYATEQLADRTHLIRVTPNQRAQRSFEPMTVPAGQCFVMGDNRDLSFDSRRFGCVARDEIVGRVVGLVFSLDRDRYFLPRSGRWFRGLE